MAPVSAANYHYGDKSCGHHHAYLLPPIHRLLKELLSDDARVFELGCGNGSIAHDLREQGFDVIGVDPSVEGIAVARQNYPELNSKVHLGSAYDDLASIYGRFPAVISLEVVEHIYHPRAFARTVHSLLCDGGFAVISTPFHGYWKNLALALSGKMDQHFTALWDNGHIKFWSERTLSALLREAGLEPVRTIRTGRIPPFAKSMIMVARRSSA